MATLRPSAGRFHRSALVTGFLAVAMASPVAAQNTPVINTRSVGAVYVRSAGGSETRGQLLRLGPDTLTLLEQGTSRDIPLADVTRIDARGDSVKNGAIIGAVVVGVWCALVCPQGLDGYSNDQLPYILGVNIGLGAAVGAGIDAMHVGRTTIYQAAGIASAHRLNSVRANLSLGFKF
jgi:hypothetical protein